MIEKHIEIVFNKKITVDTFLMGLRSPEIVEGARPGQFVMIRVRSGFTPFLRRPFSICGIKGRDLFLILYRVVGEGTSIMVETKEGEKLSVMGPLGKGFDLPKSNHEAILVAGGIGIAPLFFLAQTMNPGSFHFMAGFGSASEIITLTKIIDKHIDVSIATDDGTEGYAGPVTGLLEESLKNCRPEKGTLTVFACGPQLMLKKVSAMTLNRDVLCHVSLEAHMACGLGACQGCAVKASSHEKRAYYHVCKDGPVFDVQFLDWSRL